MTNPTPPAEAKGPSVEARWELPFYQQVRLLLARYNEAKEGE